MKKLSGATSIAAVWAILLLFQAGVFANPNAASFSGWSTVGPSGGDAREVVIDPQDRNKLYLSTIDGQVYSSVDAGRSWRLLKNFNRPQLILDQLLVDPRDSNVIYVSGHRHKQPGGFFKTTDGGVTWKEAKELKDEAVHAMVQSEKDPNFLLAGTVNGVWYSRDSGDNWKRFDSASTPTKIDSLAVDPRDVNTIYAGTWWRAYKTSDGGKNWKLVKDGMIDDSDVFAIDIDPRNPDNLFASACSGIYYSSNKAEKWAKVQGIPSDSRRTRDILQHPTVAGTVYAGTTEGFWMTADNGKSWALTTSRQLEVNSIAVHPTEPNRIYIATNNYGLMVSNDYGKSFNMQNGNLSTRLARTLTVDVERPNRLYSTTVNTATGGGFVFISDDGGQTWNPAVKNITVNRVIPFSLVQDRKAPNVIYLGTSSGIFKSIDRGGSWMQITGPKTTTPVKKPTRTTKGKAPAPASKAPVVTKVAALKEIVNVLTPTEDGKNGLLAGTNKGLFRTYDINTGWEKINLGLPGDIRIFAIHSNPAEPETIWVGTEKLGVLVSRDSGKTWERTVGLADGIPVSSIAVDPKNPQNVYVGTVQAFYLSRDGGKTWRLRGGKLPFGNFVSILINPSNSNELFVSSALETNGGIYHSLDAGQTWNRVDSPDANVASRRVWALAFDPRDTNRIYAGTHSAGVYRIERPSAPTAAQEPGTRPRVAGNGN